MMTEQIRTLISQEEIEHRLQELAEQINADYEGKQIQLICILKGSIFVTCELARRITVPLEMDFIALSSYGNGTKSSGRIQVKKDLDEPIEGKDVLVVEDIIDSGVTLDWLLEELKGRRPASIRLLTLLDKPERRLRQVEVDYTGFQIPDAFVVGFGLDYAQRYRNLPYIGVVSFADDE